MKQQVDQHCSERSFEEGDWVFLRLQPYKHMSLKQLNKDNKLAPKYYGPYKVLHEDWYYGLQVGASCIFTTPPSFPCFLIKKVIGDNISIQTIFPYLDKEGKVILDPKKNSNTRTK